MKSASLYKILSFAILASLALLPLRPDKSIPGYPVIEDAFYCFAIAENIAAGYGVTAGGGQLTNGFQPLYTFLISPVFYFIDGKILPLRIIIGINALFYILSAFFVGKICSIAFGSIQKGRLPFWAGFFVYLVSILAYITHFNGLESGLSMLILSLLVFYYLRADRLTYSNSAGLGIILGFLVLARIDAVFLAIIIPVWLFLNARSEKPSKRFMLFAACGGLAFLISSPWWAYNYLEFGSIMPTSGRALQDFDINSYRAGMGIIQALRAFAPHTYTLENILTGWPGIIIRLLFVSSLAVFVSKAYKDMKANFGLNEVQKRLAEILILLFISFAILFFWYVFNSLAAYFYLRYFAPYQIISVILISFAILYYYDKIAGYAKAGAVLLSAAVIAIGILYFFRIGMDGSPHYNRQLPLIMRNAPPGDVVASAQTGTIGYFRENVLNLDGKVNSEAIEYQDNMIEYLEIKNAQWFCDWEYFIRKYLGENPEKHGWELKDSLGVFYIYKKIN